MRRNLHVIWHFHTDAENEKQEAYELSPSRLYKSPRGDYSISPRRDYIISPGRPKGV